MLLDDAVAIRRLDSQAMIEIIAALPSDLAEAWAVAASADLHEAYRRITRLIIVGVDAAATAGEIVAALLGDLCNIPILVWQRPDLPAYADGQSALVLLIDPTGTTPALLAARDLADARGTKMMVITAAGSPLAQAAIQAGTPLWPYPYQGPARQGIGQMLGLLLGFVNRLGLVRDLSGDVAEAVTCLRQAQSAYAPERPPTENPPKRYAAQMIDRLPLIYASGNLAPIAQRWKNSLNQNAKTPALAESIDEMLYNGGSGLANLPANLRLATFALVSPLLDSAFVTAAHDALRRLLMMEGIVPDSITASGESPLAQMLSLLHFGDYVSYYLAIATDTDPTPTPARAELKRLLGKFGSNDLS
jgi:glucose/mannose-6-phosphate isomerase